MTDLSDHEFERAAKQDGFRPPQAARNNARRGLELREEFGRGGTAVGIARARDIANGRNLSLDTIRRMVSFFARHEDNKDTPPEEGNGMISSLLWGGDAGRRWAEGIINRMDKMGLQMGSDQYSNGGEVNKSDDVHRIVGGWFSVFKLDGNDVVDSDNETIDIDSYRAAAIDFAKEARIANFNHEQGEAPRGTLIDNLLIDTEEFAKMLVHEITGLPLDDIPVRRLGHFGSFQVHDPDDYREIRENGAMFSIEGSCNRVRE